MRLAVLADIHANVWALDRVLADAEARGVEGFVNLGDVLFGPLDPRGTWERVRGRSWLTVRGNQDRALYQATAADLEGNPTLAFVLSEIGPEAVEWCRALPATAEHEGILLCHGTPASDLEYLLEEVSSGYPHLRDPEVVQASLEGHPQGLILCGHTHLPRTVGLPDGRVVLNPGSVGLPAYDHDRPAVHRMESGSSHARYAIVERRGGGPWTLEHRRVPYPHEQAARRALELGRDDWCRWISTGFARG